MPSLDKLKQLNKQYNIFTAFKKPNAAHSSKFQKHTFKRDAEINFGLGPLNGTTTALKDLFVTSSMPTTCSSKILNDYIAPHDSTVSSLLTNAGAEILGKTNMDEFGMGNTGLNGKGPTLNPNCKSNEKPQIVDYHVEKTFYTISSDDGSISNEIILDLQRYEKEHRLSQKEFKQLEKSNKLKKNIYYQPVLLPIEDQKIPKDQTVTGGSSSGSAACVALGLTDYSIGSDTGGSVRLPAAYCNIYGFKPTYGRISRWGMIPYAQSLDTVGIFTKDIGIMWRVFSVLDVHDERDPTCLTEELKGKASSKWMSDKITGLSKKNGISIRIGIPEELVIEGSTVGDDWAELLEKMKQKLNVEIVPVSIPAIKYSLQAYYTLVTSEASSNLSRYDGIRYGFRAKGNNEQEFVTTRTEGFGEEVKRRITLGTYALSSYGYDSHFMKATKVRSELIDQFNEIFRDGHILTKTEGNPQGVDFLVMPTSVGKAPLYRDVVQEKGDVVNGYINDVCTIPASLAGLPAINIPFKTGFQIIGQHGLDYKVLEFARDVSEEII
ncbi:glutamyl-tRNA(Gln) amidotransferase subunit [Martiniozyma asiatica (nom. inval.)]|nr:glutamyl-tRNA(Gln) amidotransferase subunit [Martiniozyma asiatica]